MITDAPTLHYIYHKNFVFRLQNDLNTDKMTKIMPLLLLIEEINKFFWKKLNQTALFCICLM